MAHRAKYRRKQYLIEKRFQMRYTAIILCVMFLTSFIAVYTTYFTSLTILGEKLANVYPQGRLIPILNTVNLTIIMRMLFVIPFLVVGSILISHRIAGPVYRIRRHLETVGDGDLSVEVHLRKGDELKNLAEAVNRMQRKLKFIIGDHLQYAKKISAAVESAKKQLASDAGGDAQKVDKMFEDLERYVVRLNENLNKFKLAPSLELEKH